MDVREVSNLSMVYAHVHILYFIIQYIKCIILISIITMFLKERYEYDIIYNIQK